LYEGTGGGCTNAVPRLAVPAYVGARVEGGFRAKEKKGYKRASNGRRKGKRGNKGELLRNKGCAELCSSMKNDARKLIEGKEGGGEERRQSSVKGKFSGGIWREEKKP